MIPKRTQIVERFKVGDRVITPKHTLYVQGEYSHELYNVLSGWLILYVILESGARQILDVVLPGAFIGYQSDPDAPMHHSAEALTPVSVCVFPRRSFESMLRNYPELSYRLNKMLAIELNRSRTMLINLGSRMAFAALANLLIILYRRSREALPDQAGAHTAFVPLTQEHLASAIGTSSVHVCNLMKELRIQGLVEFHTPLLTIKNLQGLMDAACYDAEW